MVLAQETDVICLDEPVNHLDMAHQLECLDLVQKLNGEHGRTVVLVLHDLNLAARYADQLVFVKDGTIAASGAPETLMTKALIAEVFGVEAMIITDPVHQRPLLHSRALRGLEQAAKRWLPAFRGKACDNKELWHRPGY